MKKKYRCLKCGNVIEILDSIKDFNCSKCNSKRIYLEEITIEDKKIPISDNNLSIHRIINKCVNCGICKKTCLENIGSTSENPICLGCGKCILSCPVGALVPKYNYQEVKEKILDSKKVVVAIIAPATRVSLGESFGLEVGTNVEEKLVTCLKKLGFDYVFDGTFGADLTVMEEASELLERIKNKNNLPQFTSCCPSWVKYVEVYHPELINNLSTCKSPISMENTLIKNYFSKINNINKDDIVTVSIVPCTSKKMEINREELPDGDYALTTSELSLFIKDENIDFIALENSNFDSIFSKGSGAGILFGITGGVTEAVIRTLYYLQTGRDYDITDFKYVENYDIENIKEKEIIIDDLKIKVAVVYGLKNFEKFLLNNINDYDFIEVMSCLEGCVGGGGQPLVPINKQEEIFKIRKQTLKSCDKINSVRYSYLNPDIKKVYHEYLGYPLSGISNKLLHTIYQDKSKLLKDESFNIEV